ncbi:A-kinase anchor protein 7 isoform X2 [Aplysia californica]|uniref:A-kinase anchor protein 7 isoform X2 n=1 Tax=Aplysia californica TaxID=6500 RepID=A0ABM0JQP6_APLCA|nr:A-kinase anchor protein 7 isoform X2 [Aplysia californica]
MFVVMCAVCTTGTLREASGKRRWKNSSQSPEEGDSKGGRKTRPNYFVAVQVSDPQISDVAKKIKKGIQDAATVDYDAAFIGTEKFHITLMVMHLANEEEVQRAAESLDQCVPAVKTLLSGQALALEFEGLSAFSGGRVLYACLNESEGFTQLHQIAEEVTKQMEERGIVSTDCRAWQPHMTLMKFQGDKRLLRQGIKRVDPLLYEPYKDITFGTQVVRSLQLCQMEKKREDGYYFVDHETVFAPKG